MPRTPPLPRQPLSDRGVVSDAFFTNRADELRAHLRRRSLSPGDKLLVFGAPRDGQEPTSIGHRHVNGAEGRRRSG